MGKEIGKRVPTNVTKVQYCQLHGYCHNAFKDLHLERGRNAYRGSFLPNRTTRLQKAGSNYRCLESKVQQSFKNTAVPPR